MPKTRVFALAKELGLESRALIAVLVQLGVERPTPASQLDEDMTNRARATVRHAAEVAAERAEAERATAPPTVAPGAVALAAATGTIGPSPDSQAAKDAEKVAAAQAEQEKAEAARAAEAKAAAAKSDDKTRRRKPAQTRQTAGMVQEEPPADVEEEKPEEEEEPIDEEAELRELERELQRIEREERRGAGMLSLEALTPEEREEERTRGQDDLVKPIPERARRPVGERTETAEDVWPVVCVLGHVDHGKTTLLDAIRKTNVVDGEAGGITQHIGASEVVTDDGRGIVFLDTPGHAAFTAMRARGAMITDIAILIVAADDGIMPQTIEAINHVRSAGVPIIVAINKIDMPGANIDRINQQLAEHQLVPEAWGGDTVCVQISALQGEGIDDLLEMIWLIAETEVGDIWGDPEAPFAGVIVESELDPSRGPIATVLVRNGSLKATDILICGAAHGRVRRLNDWRGKMIKGIGPGHPVQAIGLSNVVEAGEVIEVASSAKASRQLAEERAEALRDERLESSKPGGLADLFRQFTQGDRKDLNLIIKTDVWGSLQAMRQAMYELNEELEEVDITIIHDAVGDVSESDVLLAVASSAMVIGFHVEADANARSMAGGEGIDIRIYDIIYEALDEIRAAMHGMLDPVFEEQIIGHAEVLQVFKSSQAGVIAGCRVSDGRLERGADMRVTRGSELVYEGRIDSLRHLANDVREIDAPSECGVATHDHRRWAEGDIIEAHLQVEVPRRMPAPTDARPQGVS